jgi:hypothetical protein
VELLSELREVEVEVFSTGPPEESPLAGVWRLMETLDRYSLRANMSVSAQAAEQHPNVIAAVIKAGTRSTVTDGSTTSIPR